jgi:hypothetical protein
MDDRNTLQFNHEDLTRALVRLEMDIGEIRSDMVTLAGQIHTHNARKDAENVQHNLDWITHSARHMDRLMMRKRQVESAIRILNRLVKAYPQ